MATVLITGTSVGIGYESALAFARAGHQVAATMRNPERAPRLAEQAARDKLPLTVSAMDVDSDASVTQGIAAIVKAMGPVDVLVNNAGIERGAPAPPMLAPRLPPEELSACAPTCPPPEQIPARQYSPRTPPDSGPCQRQSAWPGRCRFRP